MIRFLPDTWRDAILRPVAMAAPDSSVYVEIMAPDLRFAVILLLALLLAVTTARRKWRLTPGLALLGFIFLAFVPWLSTTGNGRYFIPILLAAGPVCVALIYHLPFTKSLRATAAIVVLVLQGYAVYSSNPWHSWGWVTWNDKPFFDVEIDQSAATIPATYVTVSSISYSLLAPRFAPDSRWTNLGGQSPDSKQLQKFLGDAKDLKLLVPTLPNAMNEKGLPNTAAFHYFNDLLVPHRLAIAGTPNCRMLRSKAIAEITLKNVLGVDQQTVDKFGFWICSLEYSANRAVTPEEPLKSVVASVFSKLEKQCPRVFQSGGTATQRLPDGYLRFYSDSDSKIYVLDSGAVYFKYYRALNPVLLGTSDAVLSEQFKMDCNKIHGRSGLPWEREI